MRGAPRFHRWMSAVAAGALAVVGLMAVPAQADTLPVDVSLPTTVSADALPTVQINGVVWSQQIVGNTVYVGGNFTSARPAGSPAGSNETPRSHMLAYNLTTGALITGFAPVLNGQVKDLAVSPDQKILYAAGQFTTVNGQNRYRVAAFDIATGALVPGFRPAVNATVNAVSATGTAVFIGGALTTVNGAARNKVAAVSASNGATLPFSATIPSGSINAMTLAPDEASVVIGGSFTSVNGSSDPGYGLARLDAATGASLPLPVNAVARNAGTNAAILSLETDGENFYGSGYHFGGAGTIEGAFAADWATGNLVWVEDCHGDTYSAFPAGDVVYQASHKHYCGNSGGFPQTDPWTYHHGTAVSKAAMGVNTADIYGYPDHPGQPSPKILTWWPDFTVGTFTGITQGPWTVSGNDQYVLMGGEFTRVNNTPQQGLVRFAVSEIAPNQQGPRMSGANFPLGATSFSTGTVRVSWKANYDRDNETLVYSLYRGSTATPPIYQTTMTTPFWDLKGMGYLDTGLTAGSSQRYRLVATDPFGNIAQSEWVTVTVSAEGELSDYAEEVLGDEVSTYWRLGEPSGSTVFDWAGWTDGTANSGVSRGTSGAIIADTNAASSFDGTPSGFVTTASPIAGPDTFTVETWVRTTSSQGGKLIGFGNNATGNSSNYDRHVYMDDAGRIWFGVYPGGVRTVNSAASYNDGEWHHVVASLGSSGMRLYVDGKRVGQRTDVTSGQGFSGYWRVGGDNLGGWTNRPSSDYLNGALDEVAIYPSVLTYEQVLAHYTASGRTPDVAPVPADAYGAAVRAAEPDLYWRLDEATGTTAADTSVNESSGTYRSGYTLGAPGALQGVANTAVTFDGTTGLLSSDQQFTNPSTYSEELWFQTTTTNGGKLIGFGGNQGGLSPNYDRHVYMENDGRLTFGVWTGSPNTITSPAAYNDGQWHHMVATQSSAGMVLYVDGVSVGTNGQTQAQDYSGYWKVGSDNTWGPQPYFAGTIDEVAIYSHALTAGAVAQHYALGTATPPPNVAPVAAFTSAVANLGVSVDASGSSDADGTIASYAWDFGDGATGTGKTTTHTYAAAGTYTVALTVTDDDGATGTIGQQVTVTAAPVNVAPVAAFTSAVANLGVSVDASGSSDADGTIASYAWGFGDGATGTGQTTTHTYAAAGTYTITLTVIDDDGATGTIGQQVTVTAAPVNVAPVAAFTSSVASLAVSVDASGSSDPDGTIASYAWGFGDGATGTGQTATHTYATAGTYTVALTVTDDDGATGTTTGQVTATPPPVGVLAQDGFARTVANGWGNAEVGGAWTTSGTASLFSVDGATGRHTLNAGRTAGSFLAGVSSTNTEVQVTVSADRVPLATAFLAIQGRRVGTDAYAGRLRMGTDGSVQLHVTRGNGIPVAGGVVPGLTFAAGDRLQVRVQVEGTSPTTVRAKVWRVGTTEPATWGETMTDNTIAALQTAGGLGLQSYTGGVAANPAVVFSYDNLWAGPIG